MQLLGIHHITAVTSNASLNVAFYTQVLGLRLVKKTVNQDDVSAYHLFYADEDARPGTDLTFFDWPTIGFNRTGSGMVSAIGLSVAERDQLDWWEKRFDSFHVEHDPIKDDPDHERAVLAFRDPEGQRLELVADHRGTIEATPWKGSSVPADRALRGFAAVALTVKRLESTARLLTELLDFRQVAGTDGIEEPAVFAVGRGGPGSELRLYVNPNLPHGRLGAGGVHHVAWRTPNADEHKKWREHLAGAGVSVTPVIDRFYFKSIYFREPGGVLFEIATDGPGFATDEDIAHLGERLALPPFLEPHRKDIEANLKPIIPPDLSAEG